MTDERLDPHSDMASAAIQQLRSALPPQMLQAAVDSQALPGHDDFVMLRFLVARRFDVQAAAEMIHARIKWCAIQYLLACFAPYSRTQGFGLRTGRRNLTRAGGWQQCIASGQAAQTGE